MVVHTGSEAPRLPEASAFERAAGTTSHLKQSATKVDHGLAVTESRGTWLDTAEGAAAGCLIGHHEANKRQNVNQNRQRLPRLAVGRGSKRLPHC